MTRSSRPTRDVQLIPPPCAASTGAGLPRLLPELGRWASDTGEAAWGCLHVTNRGIVYGLHVPEAREAKDSGDGPLALPGDCYPSLEDIRRASGRVSADDSHGWCRAWHCTDPASYIESRRKWLRPQRQPAAGLRHNRHRCSIWRGGIRRGRASADSWPGR